MVQTLFDQHILKPLSHHLKTGASQIAFLIDGVVYTYQQLDECVSSIREKVVEISSDTQICALAIHDDLETYATIIALWMQGKAFVPLHPNQPLERNLNIIGQIETRCIFDSDKNSPFRGNAVRVIDTKEESNSKGIVTNWETVSDNELAYILFTSGSTGIPKGVCITRKNIASFIDSFWKTGIQIDNTDRCLQAFDLTFDVSIQSFLVALLKGACVCTIPLGQVKYLYAASLMMEQGITFGAMAPSMLTYLRPYFGELEVSSLRNCILTAEACPIDLLEDWLKCAKNANIYDFYGPTEATIYCTYYKLNRCGNNLSANGIISIGQPLSNVKAIIINEEGEELETEQKGELCVAGEQISKGYWRNEERNKAAFFERNENGIPVRYYHTGDLCYWDKTGNIIYLGRIDQQAKIQGFRVELGEIEHHARQFFNNQKRTIAIAFDNEKGLTEIALFIESKCTDTAQLIAYLENKMPHYMIPSRILFEEAFPLNNSDKIDRTKLKQKIYDS